MLTRRLAYLARPDAGTADGGTADTADGAGAADGVTGAEADAAATERRKKFAYRPNLLVVDGGEPQVAAAARALEESGVEGIYLCGIAKRLEEIWTPEADFPVILPRNSDALFLFQRVRDEAHRFAITHQRQRRAVASPIRSASTAPAPWPARAPGSRRAPSRCRACGADAGA